MTVKINAIRQDTDASARFAEEQVANTNGGTFTNAAWRQRTLNTTKRNTIPGCSLASNQVTLPSGIYDLTWVVPSAGVAQNITRIWNVTANAALAYGYPGFSPGAITTSCYTEGRARVTLTTQTTIQVEHYCTTTTSTFGFGRPMNLDTQPEVFSQLIITKVA